MPGRPPRADVTEALRLEASGASRKEIYRLLGKDDEQHALREAMRQRKARKRRRGELTVPAESEQVLKQ
jgi:hypothetical protein